MTFEDDTRISHNDGDIKRTGTICRHNFPVEHEILDRLKFKVGDVIQSDRNESLNIETISYDLFKGRVERFIRYEFTNYTFIWVQNEDDYEIAK